MKVSNFSLLLTCLALTPTLISSHFLFYGSNEGSTALNTYGKEVCPREENIMNSVDQGNGSGLTSDDFLELFVVGSPAMSFNEILGISSPPFEQLEGELLWENGQAVVEGTEEAAESMVEMTQEGFAPVIEMAEEGFECVETFVIESYEDLLQFYELFPWFDEAADEDCDVADEKEEVAKTPEADLTEEEEKEFEVAVVEQQEIAPVTEVSISNAEVVPIAENASTLASLRKVEREKVMKVINSIISVGFLGSISLAYLSVASIMYLLLNEYLDEADEAQTKQQLREMLTQLRKERRRKTGRRALPAPKKRLALPAPPPPKKDQYAQTEDLPWPLDGECSSETNVSMGDVSQSCA